MLIDVVGFQENMLIELDLGYNSSPLYDFISYFNSTYGHIGFEIKLEADLVADDYPGAEPSNTISRRLSVISPMSMNSDSTKSSKQTATVTKSFSSCPAPIQSAVPKLKRGPMQDDYAKDMKNLIANKASKDSSYDVYALVPPSLSYPEGLSIFSECLVTIWQSYIRGCKNFCFEWI
jgi:hypothetical protein